MVNPMVNHSLSLFITIPSSHLLTSSPYHVEEYTLEGTHYSKTCPSQRYFVQVLFTVEEGVSRVSEFE